LVVLDMLCNGKHCSMYSPAMVNAEGEVIQLAEGQTRLRRYIDG